MGYRIPWLHCAIEKDDEELLACRVRQFDFGTNREPMNKTEWNRFTDMPPQTTCVSGGSKAHSASVHCCAEVSDRSACSSALAQSFQLTLLFL